MNNKQILNIKENLDDIVRKHNHILKTLEHSPTFSLTEQTLKKHQHKQIKDFINDLQRLASIINHNNSTPYYLEFFCITYKYLSKNNHYFLLIQIPIYFILFLFLTTYNANNVFIFNPSERV